MLNAGIPHDEILRRLDLSKEALRQHILRIDGIADQWLEYIGESGHMLEYRKNLKDLQSNRKRLQSILKRIDKKLKKNPHDIKVGYLEVQTISQLDRNIQTHWELLTNAPLVASFRKFIQKNIIDGSKNRPRKGLPLLPEEIKD